MASPQKENGYTPIANEIMDALCKTRIAGEQRQVFDAILRKTYGYNKTSDKISLSQFCQMTLMSKSAVCRAIRHLRSKGLIKTTPNRIATDYSINKNYEKWVDYEPYNRAEIFKRDKNMCHICHSVFSDKELEVDHVIPLWLNGSNNQENLAASCKKCNRAKGIERVRYTGDKTVTVSESSQWQKSTSDGDKIDNQTVTKKPHTKDTIQKTVIQKKEDNGQARLVVEIIDAFVTINPACKKMYGNKVQRESCIDLIETYSFEKVKSVIEKTLPKTNGLAFFPTILTPHQLFQDWARLESAVAKYKSRIIEKQTQKGRGLEQD